MLRKLMICLLGHRASSFYRAVKVRNKVYIVQIEEYEPSNELKMEKVLGFCRKRERW